MTTAQIPIGLQKFIEQFHQNIPSGAIIMFISHLVYVLSLVINSILEGCQNLFIESLCRGGSSPICGREKVFGNIWQRPHHHSPLWQLTKWKRLSWLDVFYSGYTTKGASNCCGMIQPPVTTNLTQTSKKQTLFIEEKIIQMWKLKSMTFSTQQI